jgi:hypothetical protein
VAAYFAGLQDVGSAQHGRILTESVAPFFITSCDGTAAKILGSQGVSRLAGRRLQGIAHRSCDIAKLDAALRAGLSPHRRAFVSFTTQGGNCVPALVQMVGCSSGVQLEILLFPSAPHPLLLNDSAIHVLDR